jgi:hypothetical protein
VVAACLVPSGWPNHPLQRTGGQRRIAALRLRQRSGVVPPPPLSFALDATESLPHMSTISELEGQIRDFINNPRKQHILLQDRAEWNKLCSSLDVIGDTELAIAAYIEDIHAPATDGQKYLILYGILQMLFVQQDAVKHMAEALGLQYEDDPLLSHIRELRNDSIGHPTKRGQGKGKSFNFITRISMSRSGFTLMTTYPDKDPVFTHVNVPQLIHDQRETLRKALIEAIERLKSEEMEHRKKHRDEKLVDAFPQTLTYYFEKISEAIHGGNFPQFGALHVDLVSEAIERFKTMLTTRGFLNAYDPISYHLELVEYPLAELKKYFDAQHDSKLNAKDAYIFLSFIRKQVDLLKQIAIEIDEEYATDI